jgi:hypothetical protein
MQRMSNQEQLAAALASDADIVATGEMFDAPIAAVGPGPQGTGGRASDGGFLMEMAQAYRA